MTATADGAPRHEGLIPRDTPAGFELVGMKKKAAIQLMVSRLRGRFNPNLWDPVYAAETGLRAPIQTGEMSSACLSEMCANYFGKNFFAVARMVCKYVNSTYANEVITTHGVVREKTPAMDETGRPSSCAGALVAGQLAKFKVPKHILFIDAAADIPLTPSGRPREFLLIERVTAELRS